MKRSTKNTLLISLLLLLIMFIFGCSKSENQYIINECIIDRVDGGQVVTCGADQIVIPDQMPITAIVDPCGDGPGVDEVVLILEGNMAIAWYKNVGMVVLEPYVHYTTTDRQKCKFQITDLGLEEL